MPRADQNTWIAETGCLKEQRVRDAEAGGAEYAPEFLENLEDWLLELGAHLRQQEIDATPSG